MHHYLAIAEVPLEDKAFIREAIDGTEWKLMTNRRDKILILSEGVAKFQKDLVNNLEAELCSLGILSTNMDVFWPVQYK